MNGRSEAPSGAFGRSWGYTDKNQTRRELPLLPTSEIELAWAAGFFDGEGSTYFQIRTQQKGRQRQYGYLAAAVHQTHREVLDRFQEAVGLGIVYGPYKQKKAQWNDFWRYIAHGDEADAVLKLLWPYLGSVKRDQALEAFEKRQPYLDRPKLKTGPKVKNVAA